MKKRIFAIILTITMIAALFAGCGSKSKNSDSNTNKTETGNKTDTANQDNNGKNNGQTDAEYPVIKMVYAVVFPSTDEQAIEEELNKILREKAQAEIDLVGIEFGNWQTQLNLMLSGGGSDSIDLFNSFWYTSVSNLVTNGQVMALDDLLANEGSDIKNLFVSNELEEYLNCGVVNGVQYGIPSMYAYCTENIFYARTEDARKANIDWSQVKTIDDMSDVILKLKEANPDSYYVPGSTEPYWIPKSIDYLGDTNYLGVLTNPTESTKVENYYESEYFYNFLNHVKEWKKAGAISPDPLSNSNPTLMNLLMGVVNGTPGYAWDSAVSMMATIAQNGIDLEGTNVTEALSTTSDATTYMWHISSFCKNPEAAMRILNVLYTDPEAANLIANGIEGLTYELDENGQMVYPEGANGMADLGWAAASMAYWPNVMLCKTWYYEPLDVYEKMMEKNKTCDKSLALGFTFDSTKVANQMAACANVVAQYYTPLMYGEVDIDSTLVEFQQALKKAGIDDIIAEKQAQLDAWLQSKNK
ncbi:carbohydrate ABC transporter substrate-binding protein (CUT1 family) [Herbinix hemicellulosilytica]|uniref:Putative secreted protein n=1 Tax=Herbinix hemicellulosilytica TaxID=1564487 RepID=A0A0H5SD92_HERHM|nr:ABC transporter substrate-binding protein [Herbinix hemicellulosilytica]RBP58278.1 carbohydrate ABC transporter substrate-binding protein (CUT1 family) [Herbinix hemicellulosilytica]CRZ33322.1 putative secreted protein [Herbinix hemicellulosilytica]